MRRRLSLALVLSCAASLVSARPFVREKIAGKPSAPAPTAVPGGSGGP